MTKTYSIRPSKASIGLRIYPFTDTGLFFELDCKAAFLKCTELQCAIREQRLNDKHIFTDVHVLATKNGLAWQFTIYAPEGQRWDDAGLALVVKAIEDQGFARSSADW